jgi:hypothetical protein
MLPMQIYLSWQIKQAKYSRERDIIVANIDTISNWRREEITFYGNV